MGGGESSTRISTSRTPQRATARATAYCDTLCTAKTCMEACLCICLRCIMHHGFRRERSRLVVQVGLALPNFRKTKTRCTVQHLAAKCGRFLKAANVDISKPSITEWFCVPTITGQERIQVFCS